MYMRLDAAAVTRDLFHSVNELIMKVSNIEEWSDHF